MDAAGHGQPFVYSAYIGPLLTVSTSRRYHHGELGPALLAAALALLAEDGVEALSLRAVARRAGVSAMAPYRHYADKNALVAAVAAHGFGALGDALRAADRSAPPGDALVAQAVAYVRYALANPMLFRLMFGAKRPDAPSDPALGAAAGATYAVLSDRVAADTPAGADRDARTVGCWSLVHGLALLVLDGEIRWRLDGDDDAITRRVAIAMLGLHPGDAGRGAAAAPVPGRSGTR